MKQIGNLVIMTTKEFKHIRDVMDNMKATNMDLQTDINELYNTAFKRTSTKLNRCKKVSAERNTHYKE